MTEPAPVWRRRAARLLLVDQDRTHVLLVQGFDPRHPERRYWFTVGGGIDEGEDARAAVVREAMEEMGYAVDPADLAGPFHPERVEFSFDGMTIVQDQQYYVAVTPRFVPQFVGVDDVERDWWSPLRGCRCAAYPTWRSRSIRRTSPRSSPSGGQAPTEGSADPVRRRPFIGSPDKGTVPA